jgi:hypothetical protein
MASYYSSQSTGERILVLSDCTGDTGVPAACTCGLKTWTYSIQENSWSLIEAENESDQPKQGERGGTLVTVCKTTVLYLAPSQSNDLTLSVFDGQLESWSKKMVFGFYPPGSVYIRGLYAVMDHRTTFLSSCECKHAIIGFTYDNDVIIMWKLACSDEKGNYRWKRMKSGYNHSSEGKYPTGVPSSTVCAGNEEGLLFAVSNNGLWKYDLYANRWYHLDGTFTSSTLSSFRLAFYSYKYKEYVLLSVDLRQLKVYSFKTKAWSVTDWSSTITSFTGLNYIYNVVLTTASSKVFLYSGVRSGCIQLLWKLDRVGSHWRPTGIPGPLLSPVLNGGIYGMADLAVQFEDRLYINVPILFKFNCTSELWVLHLATMSWTLLKTTKTNVESDCNSIYRYYYPQESIVLHHTVVLKVKIKSENISITGYDTKNLSWTFHTVLGKRNKQDYRYYTIANVNSSTFLFYYISTNTSEYSCDLWSVSLTSRQISALQWTLLEQHCFIPKLQISSRKFSEADYFVKSVVVNDTYILISGFSSSSCYFDLWQYSLINNNWNEGPNVSARYKCVEAMASVGIQTVVVLFERNTKQYEMWLYASTTMSWIWHSKITAKNTFFLFVWKENVFLLDKDLGGLSYRKLVCPPGYSSPNFKQSECVVCAKGFFSTGAGETFCTPCPEGLTTSSHGSTSPSNCSLCHYENCKNGQCRVLLQNGSPRQYCQCSFGFSGDHCQDPKYILILLAITTIVGLAGYGILRLAAFWKKKRNQERSLLHHVEELTSAWQISHNEINAMELIGAGGYGEVYRCKYRDMCVAMKILRLPATESILFEFEREIKFMQTIRHPNVVLFLGAGKTRHGAPFLISEFVSRGSLRKLLDDANISITMEMQVKFCQDVARGMSFLHGLTPPRVHGDLKSDNLLISETDTVKIADFGLAKQISSDVSKCSHTRKRQNGKKQRSSMLVPLVELHSYDSPHALGASRWRAPELSKSGAKNSYRTSADVYSFAVVVWEISTRKLPFSQYKFNYEVLDAVKAGERPPLEDNCFPLLRSLMLDCWQDDPLKRPSFKEIYDRLMDYPSVDS